MTYNMNLSVKFINLSFTQNLKPFQFKSILSHNKDDETKVNNVSHLYLYHIIHMFRSKI